MKFKKTTKKLALVIGTASLVFMAFVCPVTSLSVQAATSAESTVQPRAPRIEYRYKIEDGKLYKRLYNYTTMEWIGDWIYVCDYPE